MRYILVSVCAKCTRIETIATAESYACDSCKHVHQPVAAATPETADWLSQTAPEGGRRGGGEGGRGEGGKEEGRRGGGRGEERRQETESAKTS